MQPLPQRLDFGRGLASWLPFPGRQALGDGVGVADSLVDHAGHDDALVHQDLLGLCDQRTADRRGIEHNGDRSVGVLGDRHGPGNGRQIQEARPAGNEHEMRSRCCGACCPRDVGRSVDEHDTDAGILGDLKVAA